MAQLAHVDAQLVRASRYRHQLHPAVVAVALQQFVPGQGRLALLVTDLLQWPPGPVGNQGQVDLPLGCGGYAEHQGLVGLEHLALLELPADVGMRFAGQWHHHDARGIQV